MRVLKFFSIPFALVLLFILTGKIISGYRPRCDQPCKELGTEVIGNDLIGRPVYRAACQPIALTLELSPEPKVRVNTTYTFWYRITLKNTCCARINVLYDSFRGEISATGSHKRGEGVNFHVWGPDGKEIAPDFDRNFLPDEFYPVIPYHIDPTHDSRYKPGSFQVELPPGAQIVTSPAIFAPRYPEGIFGELRDIHRRGGAISRSYLAQVEADRQRYYDEEFRKHKPPRPPKPPPGFRVMWGHYRFMAPGRYKVQVVYDKVIDAHEPRPLWAALPPWARRVFEGGGFVLGIRLDPGNQNQARDYRVHAESSVIEFEVLW